MAERLNCECTHRCRTHGANPCGMSSKLRGWPTVSARKAEEPSKALCVACAGELVSQGWSLRAEPAWRTGG